MLEQLIEMAPVERRILPAYPNRVKMLNQRKKRR